MPILHAPVQERGVFKAQSEELEKEKATLVEELDSRQAALDHAEEQKKDAAADLAGLKASLASKEETVKVSLCIIALSPETFTPWSAQSWMSCCNFPCSLVK